MDRTFHRMGCALAALLASACNPLEFEDLRDTASTVALAPADDYPPNVGFGQVIAGYGGTFAGAFQSRVAITAGADTPFTVFPLYIGDGLRLDTPTVDGCDDESPCAMGAGATLLGMPGWGAREMCVATIATETGEIKIRCEDDVTRFEVVGGVAGERFGEAAAALGGDLHPFGRAVIGAPGAAGGAGAVYRLPDGSGPVALDLSAASGVGRELGTEVAIGRVDADTVLVAASTTPNGGTARVVVASVDVATDGTVTTTVTACIDDAAAGWGTALAVADLDGDDLLDLAVSAVGASDDVVRVYSGASMPGACADWPAATELGCPDVEGVTCDDAAELGTALAVGQIDGTGPMDLLAGAPNAAVDAVDGAGAAYVFAGGPLGSLSGTDRVAVLRHSAPTGGARLGEALATAPGPDGKDEPIVGAPGADRVYVFLCSGLDGDAPANTEEMPRCVPETDPEP